MAEKDPDKGAEPDEGPSLELPSLGLGSLRRKRKTPAQRADPSATYLGSEAEEDVLRRVGEPVHGQEAESRTQPAPVEASPEEVVSTSSTTEFRPTTETGSSTQTGEAAPKRAFRLPGIASAVLTGALTGLLLVGSVKLALRGCDALRGTDSCGGPGFFLLLVILILLMALATRILRLLGRTDAGTVALLGVGMAAVVALGLLSGHLLSPWMLLVIPAVSVGTFLVGHWVSATVSAEA